MRTNDVLLDGFNDIKVLFQYLYMSKEHSITVNNGVCDLNLSMDENLRIWQRNMNFPNLDSTVREIQLAEMLSIVEQLKEQKPQVYKRFVNRWEEIKQITTINVAQNDMKWKQRHEVVSVSTKEVEDGE